MIFVLLLVFSGCSSTNVNSNEGEKGTTAEIEQIKNTKLEEFENATVDELVTKALYNCSWGEYDKYKSKTVNGAIIVSGIDKYTNEPVEITWGINNSSSDRKYSFEKMTKGKEKFLTYQDFISFLRQYN